MSKMSGGTKFGTWMEVVPNDGVSFRMDANGHRLTYRDRRGYIVIPVAQQPKVQYGTAPAVSFKANEIRLNKAAGIWLRARGERYNLLMNMGGTTIGFLPTPEGRWSTRSDGIEGGLIGEVAGIIELTDAGDMLIGKLPTRLQPQKRRNKG